MADAEFEVKYLEMCQSRTGIASLISPIGSSRSLNFSKIVDCIVNRRDVVDVGPVASGKVFLCKAKVTLVARNTCVDRVKVEWKEAQEKRRDWEDLKSSILGQFSKK